ncbi:MAG TPA: hypothetical protein VGR57_18015 [Ktedonobacterales bacterium]|nr:hypothetical protein [Ktedonobacterales bacterium]
MPTVTRAAQTQSSPRLARLLRVWLLVLIGVAVDLVALRVATYPAFFTMPGALGYLVPLLVALAIYAAAIVALPRLAGRAPAAATALRVGTVAGVIGGALDVANITLESVVTLPQPVVSVTTLAGMLGLFLAFGAAGFAGGRSAGFWLGVGAAVWSGMVAILIAITFGFLLANVALPRLAHDMASDPDYLRSGWTDVRAFAIANTDDAGFTHLLEGPIIAFVLGAAGSGLGRIGARRVGRP